MILLRAVIHILFVGNSLTYTNDVPNIVRQIGKLDGVDIVYKTIAYPNYALEDHYDFKTFQSELKDTHYDFVIAQQGPSGQPESQVMLKNGAITFSDECKKTNTTFGLYMVWPSMDRSFDLDNVIVSYANAAKETNALLCPAGLAWKLAWKDDPKLPLYGPDNFHPSVHGSVLAAMVIYASVKQKKDLDFIKKSKWSQVSDTQLAVMKAAAIASLNGL